MNLKLVLAAALFVSTGTFVAQAQHKTVSSKAVATSSAAKAFQTKINAYKTEADADKAATQFRALTVDMTNDLGKTKASIASAASDAERKELTDKYNAKQNSMNLAIRGFSASPINKDAVVEALNSFAKTL